MANFSLRIDLLRLKGAFLTTLKGSTATKRCLCIPIDDVPLFLGQKGCYLEMTALEVREAKYADTHCVKLSLPKEVYESLTQEQRGEIPILGGMHEIKPRQVSESDFPPPPGYTVTPPDNL